MVQRFSVKGSEDEKYRSKANERAKNMSVKSQTGAPEP
jgi:hypothetical protein